jgi:hypothetical protein
LGWKNFTIKLPRRNFLLIESADELYFHSHFSFLIVVEHLIVFQFVATSSNSRRVLQHA